MVWPYELIGGTSMTALEPLVKCLRTQGFEVADIKTGEAIEEQWIDSHLNKNDGWHRKKEELKRKDVVVLMKKRE